MAPTDGLDLDALRERGDAALYRAKTTNRGSVKFWNKAARLLHDVA